MIRFKDKKKYVEMSISSEKIQRRSYQRNSGTAAAQFEIREREFL